jgi:predicted nucleic acid-binding protein
LTALVCDTSVVIPLVIESHSAHLALRRQCAGRDLALTQHSLAEAYSVLTRLPGDARVAPTDAARILAVNFPQTVGPEWAVASRLPQILAPLGIAGGAVYDALVGLAALANQMVLLTRDARALPTYAAIGVRIEMVES